MTILAFLQALCCDYLAPLQALKLLTPLIRKLGPNANPGKLKELPVKGMLMWVFYAGESPLQAVSLNAERPTGAKAFASADIHRQS